MAVPTSRLGTVNNGKSYVAKSRFVASATIGLHHRLGIRRQVHNLGLPPKCKHSRMPETIARQTTNVLGRSRAGHDNHCT